MRRDATHRPVLPATAVALVVLWVAGSPSIAAAPQTAPATSPAIAPAWAFHGGGALTGQAPDIGPPPLKLRWTYHADDGGDAGIEGAAAIVGNAGIEGAAAIVGNAVFVGDEKGVLHAIDLATGQKRWTYQAGEEGIATTPLVASGRVVVGDLGGAFHAVSLEKGEKLWTIDTGAAIHASANAADPAADRVVVSNDGGKIFCVDPANGNVVWTAQSGDRINSAAAIAGNIVYIAGCDAKLLALNLADGKQRFIADIGGVAGGSPAVVDGKLVVGTDGGRVVCLTADTGAPLWTYEQIADGAMAYASPAVAGGVAVIGARDRRVHAIELAGGKPLWTFKARLDVDSSPVITGAGARVYVASKDKSLYVLDLKDGKLLWEFKSSRGITATPAIDAGVLVVGDTAGNVYCFERNEQ